MKHNFDTFIGCDASYEESSIVIFGAPFDSNWGGGSVRQALPLPGQGL